MPSMKSYLKKASVVAVIAAIALVSSMAIVAPLQIANAQGGKQLKIALVTDALFSDGGWGAAAHDAAKLLETKYGYQVAYAESIAIPDIEATLRQYAQDGYDLIIAHGFQWGDPAVKVGKDYPNTKIVVFTGLVRSNNVASIFPMQQEGTFLLGALGAMMTKTGTLAYVGGDQYPNIINIFEGYKQGAKLVKPDIKVIGTYLGDFDNPAKGKEAGLAQINNGADFLFHVADTSGHGVIQAAKEKKVYAFGAVLDQSALAPDTVLTSFVLDMDKAFDQALQMVVQNKFEGKIFKPGIEVDKAGDIELTLPKSVIDGITVVKAGDKTVEFQEISSSDSASTIKFVLPEGSSSVEISGTTVVPEFGTLVAIVLAALLVGVIGIVRFKGALLNLGRP